MKVLTAEEDLSNDSSSSKSSGDESVPTSSGEDYSNNAAESKNLIKPIISKVLEGSLKKKPHALYDANINMHANDKNGYLLGSQCDGLKKDELNVKADEEITLMNHEDDRLAEALWSQKKKKGCCSCCSPNVKLCFGVLSLIIGVMTFFYTPFDLVLRERLRMTPGLPAFDWWLVPPENVFTKLYIFNITNHEAFLNGSDNILRYNEIGPIVYKEMLEHTNVTFNDNGTLTYTAKRWPEYLPEYNTHINFNASIYHINTLVLGLASHIHNKNLAKYIFSAFRTGKSPVIVKTTIYNYLWNVSDPMLNRVRSIAQGLVPSDNLGVMYMMYKDMIDTSTVYIGSKWGDKKFFTIDKFNGHDRLPGYENSECPERIYNSTEGLMYSQRLNKESELYYWRKSLCRVVKLTYTEEIVLRGITAYRYSVPADAYHHKNSSDGLDCYLGNPALPDGLSDLSKCYFGLPVASSHPHFGGIAPSGFPRITGFQIDWKKHSAYSIVEPITGIPLESAARAQVNLVMREMNGFSKDITRFSGMTLPLFWMEISEFTLPEYVWALVIFMVRVVPLLQAIFSASLVLTGVYIVGKRIKAAYKNNDSFYKRQQLNNATKKKILNQKNKENSNKVNTG